MGKFKLLKHFEEGQFKIGTVFDTDGDFITLDNGTKVPKEVFIRLGAVEEIKEPEEFWVMDTAGNILSSNVFQWINNVPSWNRFRTKDSAEKFASFMKDSYGTSVCGMEYWRDNILYADLNAEAALNDRVK